jgi:hypothetical protein
VSRSGQSAELDPPGGRTVNNEGIVARECSCGVRTHIYKAYRTHKHNTKARKKLEIEKCKDLDKNK